MSVEISTEEDTWVFPDVAFGDTISLEFKQTLTHTHFNAGVKGVYVLTWLPCFQGQWHRLLELVGTRATLQLEEPRWDRRKKRWAGLQAPITREIYITSESSLTDKVFNLVFLEAVKHDSDGIGLQVISGQGLK